MDEFSAVDQTANHRRVVVKVHEISGSSKDVRDFTDGGKIYAGRKSGYGDIYVGIGTQLALDEGPKNEDL
jgi:hypothetical protein